jgi:murein L,D-transpeptidase YcbB/YkuD
VRKRFVPLLPLLLCLAAPARPAPNLHWDSRQIAQLTAWLRAAPQEGLVLSSDCGLNEAVRSGDTQRIDRALTALSLSLARAHLLGFSDTQWKIGAGDQTIDLPTRLAAAHASNDLDGFFSALRPRHPHYEALRQALAAETDPARRTTLIRNLERWRWMPLDLGPRYLLVNTAGYELALWENGRAVERWRVVVGKPRTPTPVFAAKVSGVTINPWWEIPPSIVRELRGRLSSSRGYVRSGGHWRQRPGPNNALGQMKLVMPNSYNVYLHDTPSKALFEQQVRAFSHGCIRVDKALSLAARLLERPVDEEVARGATVTLPLAEPLPVYVTYFTADVSEVGTVEYHDDIYGRDERMAGKAALAGGCAD